ncbi:MAG TPA: DUF2950 domain-containing protein [Planctomycetota bacterium]|nr:DUF2950 domain-containing protein [Planctomycetota bacterium]
MLKTTHLVPALIAIFFCAVITRATEESADGKQVTFTSPDAAFKALIEGMEKNSDEQLLDVLGHAHSDLVVQADKQASKDARARLSTLAKEHLNIVVDESRAVACFGLKCWPYPIPLVKSGERWRFDTAAGKEEILNRRIGRNELAVIKFLDRYDDAQRSYACADHTGNKVLKYAQRLVSARGNRDGLYWPVAPNSKESPSPLALILDDGQEFLDAEGVAVPYHGYYLKVLTKQGANPPGGKYDYVINGNMIAGFALVAWPADYGSSGVMAFTVNHQGVVYQKDFGPETAKLAAAIDEYNPDDSWKEVKAEEKQQFEL